MAYNIPDSLPRATRLSAGPIAGAGDKLPTGRPPGVGGPLRLKPDHRPRPSYALLTPSRRRRQVTISGYNIIATAMRMQAREIGRVKKMLISPCEVSSD